MKITIADVEHVARLARLELSDEEKLLFAGQMLAKRTAEEGSFKNWSRTDQVIFAFSLASTAVTGVAYSLALPAMFAC